MNTGLKILFGVSAVGGISYLAYYLFKRGQKLKIVDNSMSSFDFNPAMDFIMKNESFSATPYFDIKQWSWGYGTAAGYDMSSKPAGTISQAQAQSDLLDVIHGLYQKIMMRLTKPVTANQMTALLDFGYNLGWGDLKKIIDNINNGYTAQQTADEINLYIYAGGNINSGLVDRRNKESNLYLS